MECKQCKVNFHHCSNCGPEQCLDNGFCSYECMYESEEYQKVHDNAKTLKESLSDEQLEMLNKLLDDYVNYENDIDYIFD